MSSSFQLNQLIRLKGLNNAQYNGILGQVLNFPSMEVYCNGRYRVLLKDEAAVNTDWTRLNKGYNTFFLRELLIKPENMMHACKRCHKGGEKLMYCGKCRHARYFDQICQKNDWNDHKNECGSCGISRDASKNPLFLAVAGGDLEQLQKLVQEGADINMTSNTTNVTVLQIAAMLGHLHISQYLLEQGADKDKADKDGLTPLICAAQHNHFSVVRYLVEQGADIDKASHTGGNPLYAAAQKGHLPTVTYLVEQGADKDKTTNDGASPLYIAAQNGHLGVVRYLLEQGKIKDKATSFLFGRSPLFIAAQQGHLLVVQCLSEHGADMNKCDNVGASPLWIAADKSHLSVVNWLAKNGADKNKADNDGISPVSIAARNGDLAVVQCLVQHGADKDKCKSNGVSPLYIASQHGHLRVVKYLVEQGADKEKGEGHRRQSTHHFSHAGSIACGPVFA